MYHVTIVVFYDFSDFRGLLSDFSACQLNNLHGDKTLPATYIF